MDPLRRTLRRTRRVLDRCRTPGASDPEVHGNLVYTYDQAGNVTSTADTSTLGGTATPETQCFTHDGHRRLTEAWTPASQNCSDTRSASALGGRAPYWTSYTYNDAGQRTTETARTSTATTKTTYCYEKSAQPHALTGTSETADCTAPDSAYDVDSAGNTTTRPDGTATQSLVWSDENRLSSLTENAKTTDYLYGADGTLLIRATQDGERVLYAGATELHLRADGTTWAQRHYGSDNLTVAVRSNESGTNQLSYLVADEHGTAALAIDATDQAYSRRYLTPFGAQRGSTTGTAWPDDKGFLGKTTDTGTGLTHVGARQYDPTIGQFISVDPLLQTGVGQTLNGYSYAVQNPATVADPSGLGVPECNEPQKYGITCRGGIPVSTSKKKAGNSEGPVRACRCGSRPVLVKGNTKPTGLGGIPGRRNLDLPSTPAPKGWLKTTPPNPGPEPKKDDGFWGKVKGAARGTGGWLKDTFTTWDGWKNRVIPGLAFGTCVVVSAGVCTVAGVVAVGTTFVGDGLTTGSWNYAAAGKSLAWTLAGGGVARGLAGSWRGSAFLSRTRVKTVSEMENVTIYGYRKTVDWGATQANMTLNLGNSLTFCGVGASSPGASAGWC